MAEQQPSRLSARRYHRFADDRTPTHLLFPRHYQGPARILLRRLLVALILLFTTAIVVFVGRAGYRDSAGSTLSLLDALYYATVSLSTTGYGDIVPATTGARIVNIVIVTPLRLMFLILLVGTTLEVLTTSARQQVRARRWRKTVRDHTVIIGYGTQGRAAAVALRSAGMPADKVAVIDADQRAANLAAEDGMTAICGDATTIHVLEEVEIGHAARAVIAANRDDTAVLATLTVRQLNTQATVVAAVRHAENAPLLRSAGANAALVTAESAGQLLGVSALSPATGEIVTDLLTAGTGLELVEREANASDDGRQIPQDAEMVMGILRDGSLLRFGDGHPLTVRAGDRLVTVRPAASKAGKGS